LATTPEEQQAYHIIRVVNGFGKYGKRMMTVYYDEDPTPVLTIEDAPTTANSGSNDGFCFGTFGGSAVTDVSWDWISFTNKGMFSPGEEDSCIGSLIPEIQLCNDPFADADDDADVDQDDFAKFQACFTGGGGTAAEECICFDQEPVGGDGDVDSLDYGLFENCASGPAMPADPSCDDIP